MRRSKLLPLGALVGLILSACAFILPAQHVGGAGGKRPLADTAWIVVQLGQESGPEFQALTLEFAGTERINGHDGCNVFSGEVLLGDSAIHTGDNLIGTMMVCPDAVEARARTYRAALMQTTRFESRTQNFS